MPVPRNSGSGSAPFACATFATRNGTTALIVFATAGHRSLAPADSPLAGAAKARSDGFPQDGLMKNTTLLTAALLLATTTAHADDTHVGAYASLDVGVLAA